MGRCRRWAHLLWLALGALLLAAPAQADPPPGEDARHLGWLGDRALAAGDVATARARYEAMLDAQEITRYLPYRPYLGQALILERLGDWDGAAALYRRGITDDPLRAVQVLRILSRHPRREALVQEAYGHVRGVVERALAGEDAVIYVTSKGADRYLRPVSLEEVLEDARAGRSTRYCYLESLDLSEVRGELPEVIQLTRCVVGSITIPDRDVGRLYITGFILGDVDLGKTWAGASHRSATIAASRFDEILFRDAIFLGQANFSGIVVRGRRAYFPMAVFERGADFRGAEIWGSAEFRFASFGADANFKNLRMHGTAYFGGTRFREDVVFSHVSSQQDLYFNSATFDGSARFDRCEWDQSATFEDSRFRGPATFSNTQLRKRLNLSRTVFEDSLLVDSIEAEALDMFGAWLMGEASFVDSAISGRARFSLDAVSRAQGLEDLDRLLPLYRDYQGDEDAEEVLSERSSYGVMSVDDLITRIDRGVSFANTVFGGIAVFERVHFGREGAPGVASFFNTQFLGETHFEDTTWDAAADFSTVFGEEIAFNRARFRGALILDDAYIKGRLSLTDAVFEGEATWSWYGAEIASFQVYPEQVSRSSGPGHRLFYERCALGEADPEDLRIRRLSGAGLGGEALRRTCYDYVVDELVGLKEHYADEAMTTDEDDAYWWERHHGTMASLRFGTAEERLLALAQLLLFELCFGWGVRLGNLAVCTLVVTAAFAVLYRLLCPDTVLIYDGEDIPIREVSYVGLFFVSLQSMLAINTGWDFGDDDHRFRYLNTLQTLIGVIILTLFVGAYTRMILA